MPAELAFHAGYGGVGYSLAKVGKDDIFRGLTLYSNDVRRQRRRRGRGPRLQFLG